MRLEESFRLEIMHEVVGVIRGLRTFRTPRLAKEQLLTAHFRNIRFLRIELPVHTELRSRGKIQQFLKLSHGVHLAPAVENVDALLLRDHRVPVEIRGALLKLGKVLDGLQSSL